MLKTEVMMMVLNIKIGDNALSQNAILQISGQCSKRSKYTKNMSVDKGVGHLDHV